MLVNRLIAIVGFAVVSIAAALPAAAQMTTPTGDVPSFSPPPPTSARPRIDINPRPLYRRCAGRYVIQYRPSGTVLFPEKHCWWERW
jgi:hypothetical protein